MPTSDLGTMGDVRELFCFNLHRLAGLSTKIAATELKPKYGLTVNEWEVLSVLDYLGAVPTYVVAQRAGIERSYLTRTVSSLQQRGYLERRVNKKDRRVTIVSLTEEGQRIAREILADARRRNEGVLSKLTASERTRLMALIEKATDGAIDYLDEIRGADSEDEIVIPEPRTVYESRYRL
jgi:DNA-binding MarR family transcriptional regulator